MKYEEDLPKQQKHSMHRKPYSKGLVSVTTRVNLGNQEVDHWPFGVEGSEW